MLLINNHEIIKILCRINIKNQPQEKPNNLETEVPKKSEDPKCLLNSSSVSSIPRNKKCPVTNKKFKQCCGKL